MPMQVCMSLWLKSLSGEAKKTHFSFIWCRIWHHCLDLSHLLFGKSFQKTVRHTHQKTVNAGRILEWSIQTFVSQRQLNWWKTQQSHGDEKKSGLMERSSQGSLKINTLLTAALVNPVYWSHCSWDEVIWMRAVPEQRSRGSPYSPGYFFSRAWLWTPCQIIHLWSDDLLVTDKYSHTCMNEGNNLSCTVQV